MRKITKYLSLLLLFVLTAVLITGLAGCEKSTDKSSGNEGLWKNAAYPDDTELGQGDKILTLEVSAEEKTIRFTVHTDEATVGAALTENGLISGDEGEFGLYLKSVNGITADYDIDKSYWAFYINGEYALAGVDGTDIEEGAVYRLVYTK